MTWRWLSSPGVALISFLASVVTLGQLALIAGRSARRAAHAAGDKRRAWVLVAVAAVSMPLTWHTIVLEAGRYGQGGLTGELYPATMTGSALAGAMVLLVSAIDKERAPVLAWLMTAGGFATCACMVALHGGLAAVA